MNKKDRLTTRLSNHGEGQGTVTPQMVEERACELARIDGREADQVTEEDRAAARSELLGEEIAVSTEEEDLSTDVTVPEDPSEPVEDRGHRTEDVGAGTDDSMPERLAKEGVRDAEHERMVREREERRHRTRRDRS